MSKSLLLAATLLTSSVMASPSPNGAPKMEPSSDIIIQQNAKRIRDFLPNIPGLPLTVLLLNSKTQTVQYSVQQTQ